MKILKTGTRRRIAAELMAALLWCGLTLLTDRFVFRYTEYNATLAIYKVLFFIVAFGLIHGAVTLVANVRKRDRFTIRCLLWALPYLAVNLVIFVLIWPGAWGNDDLYVFALAQSLQVTAWYHFLSSVYQILVLMLLPFMAGTVLVQLVLASGMLGYLMASLQEVVERYAAERGRSVKNGRWVALLYLPFLLPPILLHNQQPFRPTWTSWVEVFLLSAMAIWYTAGKPLSRKKWVVIVCLGALTATWRSECVYYLVMVPLFLFLFTRKKLLRGGMAVLGSVLVVVLAQASTRYNNYLQGGSDWSYQSVAFCRQIVTAVQASDPEEDGKFLEKIDPVFDVQACKEYLGPISGAYDHVIRKDTEVTEEMWGNCLQGAVALVLRHPDAVLAERWDLFANTIEYTIYSGQKSVFVTSSELYDKPWEELRNIQQNFFTDMPALANPINKELRTHVIHTLLDWKVPTNRLVSLSWKMLPPFAVLIVLLPVLALWKKWFLFWVDAACVAHIGTVFLSAPTSYFMYYLAPYMAGAAAAGTVLLYLVLRTIKRKTI